MKRLAIIFATAIWTLGLRSRGAMRDTSWIDERRDRIVTLLRKHKGTSVTMHLIQAHELTVSSRTLLNDMRTLVADGRIQRVGRSEWSFPREG